MDNPEIVAATAFLQGVYIEMSEDLRQAAPYYQVAAAIHPTEYNAIKQIRGAFSQAKVDPGILQQAERWALLYPHSIPLHLAYGDALLFLNARHGEAAQVYEKVLSQDPHVEEAYTRLISIWETEGKPAQAMAVAKRWAQKRPASIGAWLCVARLSFQEGKKKEAREALGKVYKMAPEEPELAIFYAYLLEDAQKKTEWKQVVSRLYENELTVEELIVRMQYFLRLYKDVNVMEAHLAQALSPGDVGYMELQIQRVMILWEKGNPAEALEVLQRLVPQYESDRLTLLLGLAYEKFGQMEAAEQKYLLVGAQTRYYLSAQQQLIQLYRKIHAGEKSRATALALLTYPYAGWEMYSYVASVFAEEKDYDRALGLLRTGHGKYPTKTQLIFLQGVYEEERGNLSASLSKMEEVLQLDPQDSTALNFIGYALGERGLELDRAEKYVRLALEIRPGDGYYLDSLGWIYYKRHDFTTAVKYLTEATAAAPQEGVIYEHLGDAYHGLGQREAAHDVYKKAQPLFKEEKDQARILQKIQSMGSLPGVT